MKQLKEGNEYFWDLRIGIHTGPVIAGAVGQKKISYSVNRLYNEKNFYGQVSSSRDFKDPLAGFLDSFELYTLTEQKLAGVPAKKQIKILMEI